MKIKNVLILCAFLGLPSMAEAQRSWDDNTEYSRIREENRNMTRGEWSRTAMSQGSQGSQGSSGWSGQPNEEWNTGPALPASEQVQRYPEKSDYLKPRRSCGEGERDWVLHDGQDLVEYLEEAIPDYDRSVGNYPRRLDHARARNKPYIEYGYAYRCRTLTEFLDAVQRDHHGLELYFTQHPNVVIMESREF